jgi:hypothetical protein
VIVSALHPELEIDPLPPNPVWSDKQKTWITPWRKTREPAVIALGIAKHGAEAKEFMEPDAPQLKAELFHSWIWNAARPMWDAGNYQMAVLHAASSLNARLQQKLRRHDVTEAKLCQEAFSLGPPEQGRPRLRFPGDRSTNTWKSLQSGALTFAQGCYTAIRNPVAHDHEHPLTKQEALEQLAAFSIVARWVDMCILEELALNVDQAKS